jgi:hypothetical protein
MNFHISKLVFLEKELLLPNKIVKLQNKSVTEPYHFIKIK